MSDPDAEVPDRTGTSAAVTKDGATITGTLLNEDKYSVQILDSNDRLVSIQQSRTCAKRPIIEKSLMPSYKDKLSAKELSDLVSYLVSLKGVELP